MAQKSQRSLQEQVRYLLDQEVKLVSRSTLSAAKDWRSQLEGRNHADIVELIREERSR